MLILNGNSLPQRQCELNEQVKEAIKNNIDFNDIKDQNGTGDVEKFFKIDLASHYKNTDYIIEVLKCGDNLYISRALKCFWLYDDVYTDVINPNYLQENVFPYMSTKMKKKLLTVLSVYIQNEERAACFYTYCDNFKLDNIAFKFLSHTSVSFKINVFKTKLYFHIFLDKETEYLKQFFGNTFSLIKIYLESLKTNIEAERMLYKVRYLYFISNEHFLELLEKYNQVDPIKNCDKLGLRISRHIMKNHKDKVLQKPLTYLMVLNNNMIVKYCSIDEAKFFAISLLPHEVSDFWAYNYCQTYKYILDKIPKQELFTFVKKIFREKYPQEEFEMSVHFYYKMCYEMLTIDERESWALCHIKNKTGFLGPDQDYIWFKFVSFNKAFPEIKKYVLITPNRNKRAEIINILIESARNMQDLKQLIQYYYERHVNEKWYHKADFLKIVIDRHNPFEFDDNCWDIFTHLLYSIEGYFEPGNASNYMFRVLELVYCIINEKDIPETLTDTLYSPIYLHSYRDKLTEEQADKLFQDLLKLYVIKISEFETREYNVEVENEVKKYIYLVLQVLIAFKKTRADCPQIVERLVKLNWNEYKHHDLFREDVVTLKEQDLVRFLKKDATLTISKFPLLKSVINNDSTYRLNQLTRKLRIYFTNDLGKEYLNFFLQLLSDADTTYCTIYLSVYCIIQLADEKFKEEFMLKYAPLEAKIDHESIDRKLLYIQEGICRFLCFSRPPVSLSNTLLYLKGDYVHFCLPMFNHYLSNLPLLQSIKFIEAVLDAPLSIQKHGLRLAFKCYNSQILKQLLLSVWKKTKNVSLRMLLYKTLYNRIQHEDEDSQKELYEVLKFYTSELHQDDNDDVFDLFSITQGNFPKKYLGDYLETAWLAVSKLPGKAVNFKRQANVVCKIKEEISFVKRKFLRANIIDQHIREMLVNKKMQTNYKIIEMYQMEKAKWELIDKFVRTCENTETSEENIEIIKTIVKLCAQNWYEVKDDVYLIRKFFFHFISTLTENSYMDINKNFIRVKCVFENLLMSVLETFLVHDVYLTIWNLRLQIITREVLTEYESHEESKTFKNVPFLDVCSKFSNQVGELMVDLINKKQYYTSCWSYMRSPFEDNLDVLSRITDTKLDIFRVTFCENLLVNFDIPEVHYLVLNVLLSYSEPCANLNYRRVFEKLKSINNHAVQSFMWQEFSNFDFKVRHYL